jgi:hypothetical protein
MSILPLELKTYHRNRFFGSLQAVYGFRLLMFIAEGVKVGKRPARPNFAVSNHPGLEGNDADGP